MLSHSATEKMVCPAHVMAQLKELGYIKSIDKHPEKNIWLFFLLTSEQFKEYLAVWNGETNTFIKQERRSNYRGVSFLSNQLIGADTWSIFEERPELIFFDYALNELKPDSLLKPGLIRLDHNYLTLSFNANQIVFANDKIQTLFCAELKITDDHSIEVTQLASLPYTQLAEGRKGEKHSREGSGYPLLSIHAMCRLEDKKIALCGRDNNIMFIRECTVTEEALIPHVFSKIGHDMYMELTRIEPLTDGRLAIFSKPSFMSDHDEKEVVLQYFAKNSVGHWKLVMDKGYDEGLNCGCDNWTKVLNYDYSFHKVPLPYIAVSLRNYIGVSREGAVFDLEKGKFVPGTIRFLGLFDYVTRSNSLADYNQFIFPLMNNDNLEYHVLTREDFANREEHFSFLEAANTIPELKKLEENAKGSTQILPLIANYLTMFKTASEEKLERPVFAKARELKFS